MPKPITFGTLSLLRRLKRSVIKNQIRQNTPKKTYSVHITRLRNARSCSSLRSTNKNWSKNFTTISFRTLVLLRRLKRSVLQNQNFLFSPSWYLLTPPQTNLQRTSLPLTKRNGTVNI